MLTTILTLYLGLSIVMGFFSVTQLGYQNRPSLIEQLYRLPLAFIKGFIGWIILFPRGLWNGNYKCNVAHKIGRNVK